jgi:hypothetical protein
MSSVPEPRYCAMDEQCVWFARDGESAKLSSSNADNICESCRRAGLSPGDPNKPQIDPKRPRESYFNLLREAGIEILKSDEGERIMRFKRQLVLDLFLQRGTFWDEIEGFRARWNIDAVRGFPSGGYWLRPFEDHDERRREYDRELFSLEVRVVEERFRQPFTDWARFFSLCVMYDPPDDGLIEFSAQGGPSPSAPEDPDWMNDPLHGTNAEPPEGTSTDLRMVAHPVRWLRNPTEKQLTEAQYYRRVLQKIGERHLAPLGLDVWELFREVRENCPEIREEYQENSRQNYAKPYIEVNDWTTDNDVKNGLRLIRQARPPRAVEGRPRRDRLVAVQCALHHDRHGLTYEQVAELYGWTDPSRVGKYLRLGREILDTSGQKPASF